MTLFGRDALISAYMTLPIDPALAIGVLEALAELQGREIDAYSEEEPGRIMHETRYLGVDAPTLTGGSTYYGSADATPLFVMLLGELSRWGLGEESLRELLPHADRALDVDGPVRRPRRRRLHRVPQDVGPRVVEPGLEGLGRRDPLSRREDRRGSVGAVRGAGATRTRRTEPEPTSPSRLGRADVASSSRQLADQLKERFNRDFWLEEQGWYAVALGPDKKPVDSLTSNMGHCLWTGIVDDERAEQVAEQLMSPQMWNGWGIRTLANDERPTTR